MGFFTLIKETLCCTDDKKIADVFISHAKETLTPWRIWWPDYTQSTFKLDAIAGITTAAIIIPQSMAQALLVGVPPVFGLYGVLAGALCGALWGSSMYVVTAPVAIVSLLTFTSLVPLAEPNTSTYIALAVALAFMVGVIQFSLGFFRMGFLSRLIPHSVIAGFTVAAGIIISVLQLPNLLGFSIAGHAIVFNTFRDVLFGIPHAHLMTGVLGIGTILAILCARRCAPHFPIALTIITGAMVFGLFFDVRALGIAVVGAIPSGIPALYLPSLSFGGMLSLISSAVVIAVIGFIETYAIGNAYARRDKKHIDANQELVGQGVANVATSITGGYPVSGSFSATGVNVSAGGKTPMVGVVIAATTALVLIFFTPLLALLPKAVLAGVIIASMFQLVRFSELKKIFALSKTDGVIAWATFIIAIVIKPDDAVIAGVIIALVFFLNRLMWAPVEELVMDPEGKVMREHTDGGIEFKNVIVLRPRMSIFYANAEHVVEQMRTLIETRARTRPLTTLVIHFGSVNYIDLTACEILGAFFDELRARGIHIYGVAIKKKEHEALIRARDVLGEIAKISAVVDLPARFEKLENSTSDTRTL